MSASKKDGFSGNILFEIDCRKNYNAAYGVTYALEIAEWSQFPLEQEVLFFPYSGFRVVSVSTEKKGGVPVLVLKIECMDRLLIDAKDRSEKTNKKKALRSARGSFVLRPGMTVVSGNMKYAIGKTWLRKTPVDKTGDNCNGASAKDGALVKIRDVDGKDWVQIESGSALTLDSATPSHSPTA